MAEHTIGLMFAETRSIALVDREMRQGLWRNIEGFDVDGKTVGLLGLGSVRREVARLAKGLGMRVVAWSYRLDRARAAELAVELG